MFVTREDGVLVQVLFGCEFPGNKPRLNIWVLGPYYNGAPSTSGPKRDHNFDNHPYTALEIATPGKGSRVAFSS